MIALSDIVLRLGAATLIGCLIGLNRDLHGKPTGVRTLGLVGLGSALIVVGTLDVAQDPNVVSRVLQGVLTGIGFLGVGVILHNDQGHRVHGLTTAACVWLTACVGMVCGVGNWRTIAVAIPLLFLVLVVGGPCERWLHRRWGRTHGEPPSI